MKNLFLLLCLILLSVPAFADYKPIPKELSKQYKTEVEQIINKEYPKIIKNIDDLFKEASILYKRILKYGYYSNHQMDVINLNLIYENCIPAAELNLYSTLLKITQVKYIGIKHTPIGTDWVSPYENYLAPYFKDNNINTKKLDNIIKYETRKTKILKRYIQQVEKIRPAND